MFTLPNCCQAATAKKKKRKEIWHRSLTTHRFMFYYTTTDKNLCLNDCVGKMIGRGAAAVLILVKPTQSWLRCIRPKVYGDWLFLNV